MLLLDTNLWFKRCWRLPLPAALEQRIEAEELAKRGHRGEVEKVCGEGRGGLREGVSLVMWTRG
jgi:hypothetical protein